MQNWQKILLVCLLSVTLIGCDRITKNLAKEHLKDKDVTSYFHDTFRLVYTENTGAAMSIGSNLNPTVSFWLLSILPLIFLTGLFIYIIKSSRLLSTRKILSLTAIFAGGLSNIYDRIIFDRHVTDFLNIGFGNIRTGIFNVADVAVMIGAIGMILFYKDNSKTEDIPAN